MSLGVEGAGKFCDPHSIERARKRLASGSARANRRAGFLVLSGSFNPVHTQHVRILEEARRHFERAGWLVIAGFLAPSSDEYVWSKLGPNALDLQDRRTLCELAVLESDWLGVCGRAELSSRWVARGVREELAWHCRDLLGGNALAGVEVMGSDTAVRLLTRILAGQPDGVPVRTQEERAIC